MKVGLVLEKFDPGKGGLEHWTWQFARQLLDLGHEVHIVAFEFHPSVVDERLILHRLEMPRSRLARAAALEDYLRNLALDVIHDMGCGWYADIFHPHGGSTIALWEHNLLRIPKWRQIRFWRERRYREMAEIERRQHACTGALIVNVSRMVQGHFETLHHLPVSRMRLIYNGVDLQRFTPADRPIHRDAMRQELCIKDEVLFLMLAHNLLLKNATTLLQAAAQLVQRGCAIRVVIAGGKKPGPFMKLAARLGIARAVTFLDAVEDPTPYYAAADVFVHPTWYDPCSLVTLEAWACGLPVITTHFNGASELVGQTGAAFLLKAPDEVSALAARMEELLNPELRQRMSEAARALVLEHSFERQTAEFLRLYEEVCAEKSGR